MRFSRTRVSALNPGDWEEISPGGIEAPVVSSEIELVLFVEHTAIIAYGSDGLAWQTERRVWDDLHALRVDGSTVIADGYDAPVGRTVSFGVDLKTGRSDDAPNP